MLFPNLFKELQWTSWDILRNSSGFKEKFRRIEDGESFEFRVSIWMVTRKTCGCYEMNVCQSTKEAAVHILENGRSKRKTESSGVESNDRSTGQGIRNDIELRYRNSQGVLRCVIMKRRRRKGRNVWKPRPRAGSPPIIVVHCQILAPSVSSQDPLRSVRSSF